MPDDLFVNSIPFLEVVAKLREMGPHYAFLALYGAQFWTQEQFIERLLAADLPAAPKPNLTLVN
jgi:hypothetical protein